MLKLGKLTPMPLNVSRMLSGAGLLLAMTFLTGCAATGNCSSIPVREYGEGFKAQLVGEVTAMQPDSAAVDFIASSITLRDSVRACQGR